MLRIQAALCIWQSVSCVRSSRLGRAPRHDLISIKQVIERIVTKEVPVERTVYKELSHELYVERERYEEVLEELRRLRQEVEALRSRGPDVIEKIVTKEVPIERTVYKEIPVEVEKIVEVEKVVEQRAAQRSPPPPPAESVTPGRMVGLGLALERNSSERITFVEQVIPGFAAHQSGQFQMGDVVVAVDHQPVEELELDSIRELTVGRENTFCTLQMMRGSRYFAVTLQRVTPSTLDSSNYDAALRIAPGTASASNSINFNLNQTFGSYNQQPSYGSDGWNF